MSTPRIYFLLLIAAPAHTHPSMVGGDPNLLSYWDRLDPLESLGEHQHSRGVGGGDASDFGGRSVDEIAANISVVHVVQSNHLDIGFTDTVVNVVNLYFTDHIPSAIAVGKAMRHGNASWFAQVGALSRGHDLPGWPRNTTVPAARSACEADDKCVGFCYKNGEAAVKLIYLKGEGASDTADAAWTRWDKPPMPGGWPAGWRLRFTMQAWYLSLYLDCPPGLGLNCPSDDDKAALRAAIAAGDITWHAFPHNAELEAGNAAVIAAGLRMTHALDASLGLPPKTVLSQRDVPGLSRAMIPLLKKAGIHAVSVGVNGASMYAARFDGLTLAVPTTGAARHVVRRLLRLGPRRVPSHLRLNLRRQRPRAGARSP